MDANLVRTNCLDFMPIQRGVQQFRGLGMTSMVLAVALSIVVSLTTPVSAHGDHEDVFKGEQKVPSETQVVVPADVQKAMGLEVTPVREKVLSNSFSVNGKIEAIPAKSAEIKAPLSARVLKLAAARGQSIRPSQILAILDSAEIRQLAVEAERARTQAESALKQARAKLALAESTYQREKELLALRISSRKDFQVAQSERDQAQADLEFAQAQVKLSASLLTSRLAQLGQRGVRAKADGSIEVASPIAGIISDQQVTEGEAVEPGKSLYQVINLSRVWATAQVFEQDLSKVHPGETVEVVVAGYPKQIFRGQIVSIDPVLDPDTRTLGVRAVLTNAKGVLKPGMFATLRVVTGTRAQAVNVIPRSAVLDVDSKKIVYVQNGEAFVPTEVQLGQTDGDLVEVKDGAFPGDLVVTQRVFQLRSQTLKSSGGLESDPSEKSPSEKPPPKAENSSNGLPGWVFGIGGVLIAAGGFLAGRGFGRKPVNDQKLPSPSKRL
jgi:membrane fusion protein, heavy metal efflux system